MTLQCAYGSSVLATIGHSDHENDTLPGSYERDICRRIGSLTDTPTTARTTLSSSLWGDDE